MPRLNGQAGVILTPSLRRVRDRSFRAGIIDNPPHLLPRHRSSWQVLGRKAMALRGNLR
jgi:hypothetical protein